MVMALYSYGGDLYVTVGGFGIVLGLSSSGSDLYVTAEDLGRSWSPIASSEAVDDRATLLQAEFASRLSGSDVLSSTESFSATLDWFRRIHGCRKNSAIVV